MEFLQIRKLLLVGMLVVAGRGSVAQLFLALVISFASFALQVRMTPYRHAEDNLLKAAVEVHIFLVRRCLCCVMLLQLPLCDTPGHFVQIVATFHVLPR